MSFDEREIERKAVKFWGLLRHELTDRYGFPHLEVRRLTDPKFQGYPNGRPVGQGGPRLSEFRGFNPDDWSWHCLTGGAKGTGPISVVQYLAGPGCDRRKAGEFPRDLVDRVAVYEKVA
jgi:hypothetical protein